MSVLEDVPTSVVPNLGDFEQPGFPQIRRMIWKLSSISKDMRPPSGWHRLQAMCQVSGLLLLLLSVWCEVNSCQSGVLLVFYLIIKKKKKNFFLLFLRKRRNINEFYLVTSLTPAVAFEFWASVWPDFNLCRKLK